jgi:hypothetical protein
LVLSLSATWTVSRIVTESRYYAESCKELGEPGIWDGQGRDLYSRNSVSLGNAWRTGKWIWRH